MTHGLRDDTCRRCKRLHGRRYQWRYCAAALRYRAAIYCEGCGQFQRWESALREGDASEHIGPAPTPRQQQGALFREERDT